MKPTLTHIALHVADLEPVIEFYRSYCGLEVVKARGAGDHRVVWMAEPAKKDEFILVLIPGGPGRQQVEHDYSHLGFALGSHDDVDKIAARAERDGRLAWPPKNEPYPVGYYCGIRDPDGGVVEFSYGQPLGPGATNSSIE